MVIYFYLLELHTVFTQPNITCQESITPHLPSRQFQIILLGDEKEDEVWTTLQCGGDGLYGSWRIGSVVQYWMPTGPTDVSLFFVSSELFLISQKYKQHGPQTIVQQICGVGWKKHVKFFALPKTCHAAGRFRYKQSLPGSSSSGRWRSFLLRWGPTPTLSQHWERTPSLFYPTFYWEWRDKERL